MTALRRLLTRAGHALWRPLLRRRLGRPVIERLDGVPLVVLPEVFNPVVFRTGSMLARQVARLPPPAPGARALDMGTGSGAGAVFAARRGYRVVAVDVNPQALRCARINALLNGCEARVEIREGDLFAPVAGERFDLVLFNPPFFRGRPRDALDAAWRSEDVLERFARGLPDHLAREGRALLVLSTDGEGLAALAALREAGLRPAALARRTYGNEVITVWQVEPAAAGEGELTLAAAGGRAAGGRR